MSNFLLIFTSSNILSNGLVMKNLCDMIIVAGGVQESIVGTIRYDWKIFWELLPLLTSNVFSMHTKGKMFQACE